VSASIHEGASLSLRAASMSLDQSSSRARRVSAVAAAAITADADSGSGSGSGGVDRVLFKFPVVPIAPLTPAASAKLPAAAALPATPVVALAAELLVAPSAEHPPVTDRERRGWYLFAWASEPISAVVISGFMPLLVQEAALGAAGFPGVCPNVVRDAGLLAALFGANGTAPLAAGVPAEGFFFKGESDAAFWPSESCAAWPSSGNVYCPGWPGSAGLCLTAEGDMSKNIFALSVSAGGQAWEPSAFVAAMVAIATALQMVVFVSIGSFADYGSLRKSILTVLSVACIVLSIASLSVDVAQWWAGGVIFVLITVAYGTTFVQYNAWLPLLAALDPLVTDAGRTAGPVAARKVFTERMDHISIRGYGAGYAAAILTLVICVVIAFLAPTNIAAYRGSVAVAGFWFLAFGALPYLWVLPRPGPPLPAGANYLTLPWANLGRTIRHAWALPETFKFLACWWLFSDGMNVIGNLGSQYANAYVDWRPLPKALGLAGMLILAPIAAAAGTFFWPWCARRARLKAHHVIAINCVILSLVPAYGLLGFASPYLGIRKGWECFIVAIVYGFPLGSIQSYARAAYGAMVPEGLESQFFGLYSFTDKGSSWIGPAVVSGVLQATGTFRLSFIFPICVLLLPVLLLVRINYDKGALDAQKFATLYAPGGGGSSRGVLGANAAALEPAKGVSELLAATATPRGGGSEADSRQLLSV
jgi:UMF1 family MFS transporter